MRRIEALLELYARHPGLDLDRLGVQADLTELLLVGNVVRHGEGPSCERLRGLAPKLWAYALSAHVDIVSEAPPASERMRVTADDLSRCVRAAAKFWGHADLQPMAAREIPV